MLDEWLSEDVKKVLLLYVILNLMESRLKNHVIIFQLEKKYDVWIYELSEYENKSKNVFFLK